MALGVVGWIAWTQGALVGLRWVEFDAPLAMAALGFLAGIGGFFAPCAFALFPAYVSYYLAVSGDEGSAWRALGLGVSCAAGAILFFALVGAIVALAVVGLGIVQVLDVRLPSPALALRFGPRGEMSPALAVFLYGFGYALASTGCTLPLYVSITVLPLTSGFVGAALVTFAAFAAAMALLMLVTTVLVGVARQNLVRTMQRSVVWIRRAGGAVLILAGLYLGYYYVRAGM